MRTRAKMITDIAIQNTDKNRDPFENFEEDYAAVYYELIRLGYPIWEIEEMDHSDVSEDWISKVKLSVSI